MSTAELVSNPERLQVIEAATALVRENLQAESKKRLEERAVRMRAAALEARPLYEPGGEHTEWTSLDAEPFHEYSNEEIKDAIKG